jgi:hypothetical protein
VGSALLSAVAGATLLAAWMTYDSAPLSAQAQRYFIQALGLAQAGGNRLLGASILDAMSHQATYTGRFGEAADLARGRPGRGHRDSDRVDDGPFPRDGGPGPGPLGRREGVRPGR